MKKTILILLLSIRLVDSYSQIDFKGCPEILPDTTYSLKAIDSIVHLGVFRNTFISDIDSEMVRIIYDTVNTRWNIEYSSDSGLTYPTLLYYNNNNSYPNPPNLLIGVWVAVSPCSDINVLMPLELVYFKANRSNEIILFEWETSMERNISSFYIEGSNDGIDFYNIKEISPRGGVEFSTKYKEEIKSEFAFFRLKSIDNDGDLNYSSIIKSGKFHAKSFNVYPNPCNIDYININYESNGGYIYIIDLKGKLIMKKHIDLSSKIDISKLKNGVYYVNYLGLVKKLTINR